MVFTSALLGKNVLKTIQLARQVIKNSEISIPTGELNRVLIKAQEGHRSKSGGRFYYFTQVGHSPLEILCFVNNPGLIEKSYLSYLENQLRKVYDLRGVPLKFKVKKRE